MRLIWGGSASTFRTGGLGLIVCQGSQTVNWKRPQTVTEAKNVALFWYDQQSFTESRGSAIASVISVQGARFGPIPDAITSIPRFGP
jgi:hypothetical protein